MKDRFGHPVSVGWPAHHILWIEAAMTLPRRERLAAFDDIGEMTGRGSASVYYKWKLILRERESAKRRSELVACSRAYQGAAAGAATS